MLPFLDEMTFEVIGVHRLRSGYKPVSEMGRVQRSELRFWSAQEKQEWTAQKEALLELEAWLETHENTGALTGHLSKISDPREILQRLSGDQTLEESDFFLLKRFLFHAAEILGSLARLHAELGHQERALKTLMAELHPEPEPSARFVLSDTLDKRLAHARTQRKHARKNAQEIRKTLESQILESNSGRFDAHGFWRPGPDSKPDPRLSNEGGVWRLADPALNKAEEELRDAELHLEAIEFEVREKLTDILRPYAHALGEVVEVVTQFDHRWALIRLKNDIQGTWPTWSDSEERLKASRAVDFESKPLDLEFSQLAIIAGPNMGGKSTVLKAWGLAHWCLHHLFPVPADEAVLRPVSHIIYVGSESAEMTDGLSSFGREISRLVHWWEASPPALWLLDEVARGTHPDEGAAIATEILDNLAADGHLVVCATHFPEVAQHQSGQAWRVAGLPESDVVERAMAGAAEPLEALKELMDFNLIPNPQHEVPRDARVVAKALGLKLKTRSNA